MSSSQDIPFLIEQLQHKSSPKRRSAAKKLRKLAAIEAGPALLDALKKELKDTRTWETQYQMIMALGEVKYTESLDFLLQLTEHDFEASMVKTSIGDAITTLEYRYNHVVSLPAWIDQNDKPLVNGGIRSLAINHTQLKDDLVKIIIQYAMQPANKDMEFWVAAASPGWNSDLTHEFLKNCTINATLEDTKKAAQAALSGKYLKWNPL